MKGYKIMHEIIKCIDEREKDYQMGETKIRIKYQIAKEDDNFCALMVCLSFPPEHQSKLDDFTFIMFFHDDSISYYAELSNAFDHRSQSSKRWQFIQ